MTNRTRSQKPTKLLTVLLATAAALTVASGTAAAAAVPAAGGYDPVIRPADFGGPIDNPYLPLLPGTRSVYAETGPDGTQQIVVEVTPVTKQILGITCVVVRDTVTLDGVVVEDTADWYAEDHDGNVWYFGEATTEFEDGQPSSTLGSWEAGVDGAKPGIVMLAKPAVGRGYRQEFLRGVAEDRARVLQVDATATVPTGSYDQVVRTWDVTPLDRKHVEEKYYARGIGSVLEVLVKGGTERAELVTFTAPPAPQP